MTGTFYGCHKAKLFSDGRIVFPTAILNILDSDRIGCLLHAMLSQFGSIWIFPMEKWEAFIKPFSLHSPFNCDAMRLKESFYSDIEKVACTRHGRVRISAGLLKLAGIEASQGQARELKLIGNDDHLVLWEPARGDKFIQESRENQITYLEGLLEAEKRTGTIDRS